MKIHVKYLIVIGGLFLLLLFTELFLPKPVSWSKTLSSDDKIPYGTFVLKDAIVRNQESPTIELTRRSFFEIDDTIHTDVLVISRMFANGQEDFKALLNYVSFGNTVVIATELLGEEWEDSLGIRTEDVVQAHLEESGNPSIEDSTSISWGKKYFYRAEDNQMVLKGMDSEWIVHAIHESGDPVIISSAIGEGNLILCSNPWIFTNYYLLSGQKGIVDQVLSSFSSAKLHWTEIYSRGRGEATTPLRYVLSVPPLKWAYYLVVGFLAIFVVFEAKRKQRPIPIILPPANESLNFVKTVGNLYYEKRDHKSIALKMINFLFDQIRSKYYLSTQEINKEFMQRLTHKSGKPLINVEGLMTLIDIVQTKDRIDSEELLTLNRKIEAFLN